MSSPESSEQIARKAGQGFAFILGAKLYFLVAGYVIVVTLSWVLGRALYGVYGLVVGAISVLDNVIVTGTIQSVSRFTSADEARAGAVKAAALKLQLLVGGGVAVIFVLSAPWIAAFERDPSLTPYLRLSAGVVLCYAIYSVFVGSANGLRRFGTQAGLDAFYATLRGLLIVGLAAAGFAVWGAVGGFVAASLIIVVVAAVVIGVRDLEGGFPAMTLVRFAVPVMIYLLAVNLVMFADLFLLKRLAAGVGAGAVDLSNELAGAYVAVQQLARITYQALLAVTFIVFPLVSRSTFDEDREATRSYVATTMRYSLILSVAIAISFVALPAHVLAVPFAPEYQVGAPALAVLAPGYVAFALFIVGTTILNAAGRPRLALSITCAMLVVEVTVCWAIMSAATTQGELLQGAAVGATVGMGVGSLLTTLALRRSFGASEPLLTVVRVGLAAAAAVAVGRLLLPQVSRLVTLAECLAVVAVYGVILLISGEVGRGDLERVLVVVRRRRGTEG